jgi:hypothetical protein
MLDLSQMIQFLGQNTRKRKLEELSDEVKQTIQIQIQTSYK